MNRRKERRFRPLRWSALVKCSYTLIPRLYRGNPRKGIEAEGADLKQRRGVILWQTDAFLKRDKASALVEPQSFRMGPPGQGGLRHCSVRSVVRFC